MIGKRSLNAYKKILNIPKVLIARPDITSKELIQSSSMVLTISSSVSLEALFLKKPTITFGKCMSNIFPDYMSKRCTDIGKLNILINQMLNSNFKNFKEWDKNLIVFLKTIFSNSEKVNLYTNLLKRKNRYSNDCSDYDTEVKKISNFLMQTLKNNDSIVFDKSQW